MFANKIQIQSKYHIKPKSGENNPNKYTSVGCNLNTFLAKADASF